MPTGPRRGRPKGSKNSNPGQKGRGTVTCITLTNGERRWVFRWTIEGKPYQRTYRTEAEAEKHQEQWLRDKREGALARAMGIVLGDFVEHEWLPRQEARFKSGEIVWTTYVSLKSHWESHLEPVFGLALMHEIKAPRIEDFLRAKLSGQTPTGRQLPLGRPGAKHKLARKTTKDLLLALSAMFDDAQRRELVTANPCEQVSSAIIKGQSGRAVSAFSAPEIEGLFYQFPRRFRLLMELCFYTAMRISEVRALTWLDVANNKIDVNKSVKLGRGDRDEVGGTKGKTIRLITVGPELQVLFDGQKKLLSSRGFPTGPDDLIFPNTSQNFLSYNRLRNSVFLPADRILRLQEGITPAERAVLMGAIEEVASPIAPDDIEGYRLIARLLELPGAVLGLPRKARESQANEGVLGTRWPDFDPQAKTLVIRNYRAEPVVLNLDNELVGLLEEHRLATALRANKQQFIFIGKRGLALSALKFSVRVLDQAMRKANLGTERSIHMFRHTTATFLIYQGRTLIEVQELLGHARPSTTADIYSHAWKDAEDQEPQDALAAYTTRYGRPGHKSRAC
jgi:integrase